MAELISEPPGSEPLSSGVQSALGLGADPLYRSGVERLGALGGERQKAQAAFEEQSGGLQKQISAERASAAGLQPPKLANVPDKFEYKGMSQEELGDATQTMFALAALGGLMTRAPMTAALSAFSAGVNGLVKGDQIAFGRAKDEFDRNFKVAIAKNAEARQEYQDAFAKHRGNMADLMNEWTIIAKKHGDTVSAVNMERQDIQGQLRHIEAMGKMDQQARATNERMAAETRRITETERGARVREAQKDFELFLKEKALSIKENAAGAKGTTKEEAQNRVTSTLGTLSNYYDTLSSQGAAIEAGGSTLDNIMNAAASSGAGQMVGRAMGTESQSVRNQINQIQPLLIQEIRQATQMGSRGLDSNRELQFYLQAATDPSRDIQSNKAAIAVLDRAYGLGTGVKADEKAIAALQKEAPVGRPDIPKTPGTPPGGTWTPEKEARRQELLRKQSGAQ